MEMHLVDNVQEETLNVSFLNQIHPKESGNRVMTMIIMTIQLLERILVLMIQNHQQLSIKIEEEVVQVMKLVHLLSNEDLAHKIKPI